MLITLPLDAGNISIEYFSVEPEIILRKHNWRIRFACYLNAPKGLGLNFLLCREDDEDIYGKWIVLTVGMHTLSRRQRPFPFGFENNQQLQEELRASDESMHIYNVRFSEEIEQKILELLNTVMQL